MGTRDQEQQLIERWIEPHPWKRGVEEARLIDSKVSVWALIGYLRMVDGDVACTAEGYKVPQEAVEAALAYYRRHKALIDGRLAANASQSRPWPNSSSTTMFPRT